jgi:hypothetical protein
MRNFKTHSISLITLGILILLSAACSVNKRHYRNGYQITWVKKAKHTTAAVKEKNESIKACPSLAVVSIVDTVNKAGLIEGNKNEVLVCSRNNAQKHKSAIKAIQVEPKSVDQSRRILKKNLPPQTENSSARRQLNIWALSGFLCSLPIWFFLGPLYVLSLIASIVFCMKALNEIKKDKSKYTGKGLAIAGLIISYLVFLLIAVVVLFWTGSELYTGLVILVPIIVSIISNIDISGF